MKTKTKIKFVSLFFIVFAILPIFSVNAQTPAPREYVPLIPLPGVTVGQNGIVTLSDYLPGAFNLAVGIALALAFVMITAGGVVYATSDSTGGKASGREYIENALIGLLLVIGSFVILQTINPRILDFTIILDNPTTPDTQPPVVVGGTCTNCVKMVGLPVKGSTGHQINSGTYAKLQSLNAYMRSAFSQGFQTDSAIWEITEGYPPSDPSIHSCNCHKTGTCVDANIRMNSQLDPKIRAGYLNSFSTYATQSGLSPDYEVPTQAEFDNLRKNGYSGPMKVVQKIKAPHFSVYNPNCST